MRLRDPAHVGDVGYRGDPEPHVEVAAVEARRVVASDGPLHGRAHHDLGRGDAVVALAAADADPIRAPPDLRSPPAPAGHRHGLAGVGVERPPVHHAHPRGGVHHGRRPQQRVRHEQVVGGEQHDVVAVRPTRVPRWRWRSGRRFARGRGLDAVVPRC